MWLVRVILLIVALAAPSAAGATMLWGGGGGGGSGDVTAVGDCLSGACFDGTTGTSLTFKNATSGTIAVTPVAGALGAKTINLPAENGTVCTTGSVCSGYVATDGDLTNLAAMSGTGVVARTAADTYTVRTITESGSGIDVTNGDGVSGNPLVSFDPTEFDSPTWGDGTFAQADWTWNTTGASDPLLRFSSGSVDLITGTLKQGGTAVVLQSRTLIGGSGIATIGDLSANRTISTDSSEANFLTSGALTCGAATQGKIQVHTTPLQYCDNAATPTLQYTAYGNSSGESTAAANNSVALTTDTTGNYAAGDAEAGKALYINATSCSYVGTASDGTPSCVAAPSTPEYVSRTMTAGGTLAAYAVVAANGSTGDSVIEAATTVTQILGCSQSGSSVTSTNPVEVAVAGVARCSTDASVVSGSLVKLGATGQFALGTTEEKTWGRALTDSTGASGSAYILLFDGAEGYIDHAIDVWPSIPDLTSNTVNMINESPTVDISSNGTLRGLNFAPTSTITGTSAVRGVLYSPTVTLNGGGDLSSFYIVASGGTITSAPTTAAFGPVPVLVAHQTTYTSTTNGKSPMYQGWGLLNAPTISSSGTSGTATTDLSAGADDNPTFNQTGNGGTLSITTHYGFRSRGTVTASSGGTATVVTRKGVSVEDLTTSGAGTKNITTNIGVDIAALSNGTTKIGFRNAATSVYTPTTQAIAAASDTITCDTTYKKFTTATGTTTMTSNPTIADGQTGQICILENVDATGTDCITINDGTTGVQLVAGVTLCPSDTLTVIYDGTDWIQLATANN